MELDYIIVGQGLAGSILAHTLLERGKKIAVIDEVKSPAASLLAAGIINPVTGRRLVKSWLIDELIPFAKTFYQNLETEGNSFFHPKTIVRVFESIREQNDFLSKTGEPNYENYLKEKKSWGDEEKFEGDLGYGFIDNAFQLRVPVFLDYSKNRIKTEAHFIDGKLDFSTMEFLSESVHLPQFSLKAKQVVFCEGAKIIQNPFFNYLPFTPARGAFYLLEIKDLNPAFMIKKGLMLAPTNQENIYWAGATYDHHNLTDVSMEKDKDYLQEKMKKLFKVPYKILNIQSGVRPTTKTRRPFIGIHPNHPQLALFNGMGSKGVSLAPYFAKEFCDFLEEKGRLTKDISIEDYQ